MIKIFFFCIISLSLYAQTIKDISNIVGIRENQLIGYGLVVGLKKGDKGGPAKQSLKNLMQNAYVNIDDLPGQSTAAVMVTSSLPPFARQGDKIQVDVSTIGDASSIDGGQLLLTQLKGVDGKVYALAQGKIRASEPETTGYIYEGAIVENEVEFDLYGEKQLTLSLKKHDAKIAFMCEDKINKKFGPNTAKAYDTRTIEVNKPDNLSMVRFIYELQNINLDVYIKKKIVIDLPKQMIIAGSDIVIEPVTVARENFTIRIKKSDLTDKQWADPAVNKGADIGDNTMLDDDLTDEAAALAAGNEIVFDNTMINTKKPPTISDLVRALKTMKVDMGEIIETIKLLNSLGAINAEIEILK